MPTKAQVLAALGPDRDYRQASRSLDIPPGQAFMIATGLPADGGDTFPPTDLDRQGALATSPQYLVYHGSEQENPTRRPHVDEWVRRRAEQDVTMRRAFEGRGAAPGQPNETDVTEVSAVLTRQHDQLTAMLKQLKTIPGVTKGGSDVHQSRRASIVAMITVALSHHEAAEQEHFWPAVRTALPDGHDVAAPALDQEEAGKETLSALGKLAPWEQEFDDLAEELDKRARKHVAYEDRVLLSLAGALSREDREALGREIQRAERHRPTVGPGKTSKE